MTPFIFILFNLIFIGTIVVLAAGSAKRARRPVSDDGHAIPKEQDITCTALDGHDHHNIPRYIVHTDAETGYVVLNGVKRKISDCKYL